MYKSQLTNHLTNVEEDDGDRTHVVTQGETDSTGAPDTSW